MPAPFTHKKLTDVKDSAPEFGMEDVQEARFAKEDLDAEEDRRQPSPAEAGEADARSATSTRRPRRSTSSSPAPAG